MKTKQGSSAQRNHHIKVAKYTKPQDKSLKFLQI